MSQPGHDMPGEGMEGDKALMQETQTGQISRRPFFLRRGPMENIATALIAIGFLMLFQPFLLSLYTYSFVTLLTGTVMFIIVSKFPEH